MPCFALNFEVSVISDDPLDSWWAIFAFPYLHFLDKFSGSNNFLAPTGFKLEVRIYQSDQRTKNLWKQFTQAIYFESFCSFDKFSFYWVKY